MLLYPDIQRRARSELDTVLGQDRLPAEIANPYHLPMPLFSRFSNCSTRYDNPFACTSFCRVAHKYLGVPHMVQKDRWRWETCCMWYVVRGTVGFHSVSSDFIRAILRDPVALDDAGNEFEPAIKFDNNLLLRYCNSIIGGCTCYLWLDEYAQSIGRKRLQVWGYKDRSLHEQLQEDHGTGCLGESDANLTSGSVRLDCT